MNPSFVTRPAKLEDLPKLISLLKTLEHSLTSMPQDESVLGKRIHKSIQSFYPEVSEPGSEQYLFILEDLNTGKVLGTAAVIARIGGYEPFYTYRIQNETFEHAPLNIRKNIDVLHLEARHDGPSELGSLYLHPEFRKAGLGRLLSLSRLMFMARFPERFRNMVIAEFRGWVDEHGRSPFWDCVGYHFFEQEFCQADFLSGIGNKDFIQDLMPDYPIYLPLLPHSIQTTIGKVHRDTEPAMAILKKEGLKETNAVDIFDAGPMLQGRLDEMRIPRSIQHKQTTITTDNTPAKDAIPFLISNCKLQFCSTICHFSPSIMNRDELHVTEALLQTLQLNAGESVDIVPLKPWPNVNLLND